MQIGIAQVGHDKPLAGIGNAIGSFAAERGYTLIRNLASHGVGKALHEDPDEVPTWPTRRDKRRMHDGPRADGRAVPVAGGIWATPAARTTGRSTARQAPVVQYEHTVVATGRGAIIVTLPG